MRKTLPALLLAFCLGLAWAAPARALMTPEEAAKRGITPGQKAGEQKQSAPRPAGTIRTEDGTVLTVPKAKEKPAPEKDGDGKAQ